MGRGHDDRDHGGDQEDFGRNAEAERDRSKRDGVRPVRINAERTFHTRRFSFVTHGGTVVRSRITRHLKSIIINIRFGQQNVAVFYKNNVAKSLENIPFFKFGTSSKININAISSLRNVILLHAIAPR